MKVIILFNECFSLFKKTEIKNNHKNLTLNFILVNKFNKLSIRDNYRIY